MFERAFSEWEDRVANAPASWRASVTEREGFRLEDLMLAVAGDRIVGGAFLIDAGEIWVDKLAVVREFRRRGIARALLQTARRSPSSPTRTSTTSGRRSRDSTSSQDRPEGSRVPAGANRPDARAVAEGFEPSRESSPLHAFQACPFGRSGRPPRRVYRGD